VGAGTSVIMNLNLLADALTFLREPHDILTAKIGDKISLECLTLEEDTNIYW
jgi:hypothetical protein